MSTDPRTLAPHVDPAWADAFVLELRLRDVPGPAIGDALTEVETHVIDAGTTADDAFGDPTRYAQEVAATAGRPAPDDPWEMVPYALGAVGFVLALHGLGGWVRDGTLTLTAGSVGVLVAAAAMPFVVQRLGTVLLRFLVSGSSLRVVVVALASMVPVMALALLGREPELVTLPAAPATVAGAAMAAAAALLVRRRPPEIDPIVGPGADHEAAVRAATRRSRLLTLLVTGVQVAIAVGVVVAVARG